MELCFSLSAALNKSNYAYKMTMSAQKTLSPPSIAQHVFFSTAAAAVSNLISTTSNIKFIDCIHCSVFRER